MFTLWMYGTALIFYAGFRIHWSEKCGDPASCPSASMSGIPAHIYVHTIQGLSCWLLGWSNWWWCNITFGCVCVCVVPRIHAASSRDCSIEWLPNTWLHVCCQPRIHAASTYCSQAGLPNTTSMSYGLKNMKPDRSRVLLIVRNKFIHHPKTNYQRTAQQRSGERTNNKCTGTHQHRQHQRGPPGARPPTAVQAAATTTGGHAPTAWSEQIRTNAANAGTCDQQHTPNAINEW